MSEKELTIAQMKQEVVASFDRYVAQGTKKWGWETAAKDLVYQVGSLTKVIMQLSGERWADGKAEAELKAQLSNELADIIAEALFIADHLDIDMAEAWRDMLTDDAHKIGERTKN
jgi:NTP pyrophosphatase (non-canonical NTP hydrolase)